MDLKLDPLTGDLAFEDGDLVMVDGVDAIVQQLRIRFNFFKGEWFLDAREGTPWFQEILGQKPELSDVNTIVRQVLLTTPGISSIDSVQVSIDDSLRTVNISFIVRSESGGVINSADFAPFIVELT